MLDLDSVRQNTQAQLKPFGDNQICASLNGFGRIIPNPYLPPAGLIKKSTANLETEWAITNQQYFDHTATVNNLSEQYEKVNRHRAVTQGVAVSGAAVAVIAGVPKVAHVAGVRTLVPANQPVANELYSSTAWDVGLGLAIGVAATASACMRAFKGVAAGLREQIYNSTAQVQVSLHNGRVIERVQKSRKERQPTP